MGLFWKRKSGDQFVSLKLNEPLPAKTLEVPSGDTAGSGVADSPATNPVVEPVPTGAGPTPAPNETLAAKPPGAGSPPSAPSRAPEAIQTEVPGQKPVASGASVPVRSAFAASVLGLNRGTRKIGRAHV